MRRSKMRIMSKSQSRTKRPSRSPSSTPCDPTPSTANYVPVPEVPKELALQVATVLQVLADRMSVSEGARVLGLSRNHFQTLKNRGLLAVVVSQTSKPRGRPKKDTTVQDLNEKVERLQREVRALQSKLDHAETVVASLTKLARQSQEPKVHPKQPRPRATRRKASKNDDAKGRLSRARALHCAGLPLRDAARAVGTSRKTLCRWQSRSLRRQPLVLRPGPGPRRPPGFAQRQAVDKLVRTSNASLGAATLAKTVPGLSRRQAAALKRETCTRMEAERKRRCNRLTITTPGIVRGFDAMHVETATERGYLLAAADAAVPYKTSSAYTARYDETAVARSLASDFERHGPPLVLRLDHAKQHKTPRIDGLCRALGVVRLHGPPHHPQYYGQLERQNGEVRRWLGNTSGLRVTELEQRVAEVTSTLNTRVPRRSLGWQPPSVAWNCRPKISAAVRLAFCEAVDERHARLLAADRFGRPDFLLRRMATEIELRRLNYLQIRPGGRC